MCSGVCGEDIKGRGGGGICLGWFIDCFLNFRINYKVLVKIIGIDLVDVWGSMVGFL